MLTRRLRRATRPPMETKVCSKCGEDKPLGAYHKSKNTLDGHVSRCRGCLGARRVCTKCGIDRGSSEFRQRVGVCRACEERYGKRCSLCGIEKPLDQFFNLKNGAYGRQCWCSECRDRYRANKNPRICDRCGVEKQKRQFQRGKNTCMKCDLVTKVCTKCGVEKPTIAYGPTPDKPYGRQTVCPSCNSARIAADPVSLARHMLRAARKRADKADLEFDISVEDILPLPSHCPILKIEMYSSLGKGCGDRSASPSLDRIDNSRGYVRGNVIIISWRANALKGDAGPGELQALADFYEPLWSVL